MSHLPSCCLRIHHSPSRRSYQPVCATFEVKVVVLRWYKRSQSVVNSLGTTILQHTCNLECTDASQTPRAEGRRERGREL